MSSLVVAAPAHRELIRRFRQRFDGGTAPS
jgi:hypothetical protein